jgi:DNA-binding beta-propeller fold protein YncE
VDATGRYALRVFVACFDSNEIFVYDPEAGVIENTIATGPGPFAMAFDPFSLDDVAQNNVVKADPRQSDPDLKANTGIDVSSAAGGPASLKRYRFAYVASFTYSYVQVIDLDDSVFEPCPGDPTESCNVTFERPVFSLGQPIAPKGS